MSSLRRSLRYRVARVIATAAGRLHRAPGTGQILDLLAMGRLERSFGRVRQLGGPEDVFAAMIGRLDPSNPHTYLEFGVYRGRSMRWWSDHLIGENHRLVGFDSFQGLPAAWNDDNPAGHFDVAGQPPNIDDERVSFVKGWFDDTVPTFPQPSESSLIVNIDCDLYRSTRVVLDRVGPWLGAGDLLYFDEFGDLDHEYLAWSAFAGSRPDLGFDLVAAGNGWRHVAFAITASDQPAASGTSGEDGPGPPN